MVYPRQANFDVHPRAKRGVEWKEYLEDYQTYASATGINNSVRKRDLLLTIGGVELRRLARTLPVAPRPERQAAAAANGQPAVAFRAAEDEFTGLVRALNEYFLPQTNKEMNRDHFRQSRQNKQETTDQFYARLCALQLAASTTTRREKSKLSSSKASSLVSFVRWPFKSQTSLLINCLRRHEHLKLSTTISMMQMVKPRNQNLSTVSEEKNGLDNKTKTSNSPINPKAVSNNTSTRTNSSTRIKTPEAQLIPVVFAVDVIKPVINITLKSIEATSNTGIMTSSHAQRCVTIVVAASTQKAENHVPLLTGPAMPATK